MVLHHVTFFSIYFLTWLGVSSIFELVLEVNAPFSLHRLFVLGSVGKTPTHSVTYILMLATEVAHIMSARMWRVRVRNGPHVAARKAERFFVAHSHFREPPRWSACVSICECSRLGHSFRFRIL